jgi:hypothetical protein
LGCNISTAPKHTELTVVAGELNLITSRDSQDEARRAQYAIASVTESLGVHWLQALAAVTCR